MIHPSRRSVRHAHGQEELTAVRRSPRLQKLRAQVATPNDVTLTFDNMETPTRPRSVRFMPHLRMIGSGQINRKGLDHLRELVPKDSRITIIDLRQENHAIDELDRPICWKNDRNDQNLGKSSVQIMMDDVALTASLNGVVTEEHLCASEGIDYLRIPCQDHVKFSEAALSQLMPALHRHVRDPKSYLFIHCRAGKGRTSTALVIAEALMIGGGLAPKRSAKDLMKAQGALGGKDLTQTEHVSTWRRTEGEKRKKWLTDLATRLIAEVPQNNTLKLNHSSSRFGWDTRLRPRAGTVR